MMTEPHNLRWGILGCARISRRGLIPGIQQSQSGSLLAIASRDDSTARTWADEFGIKKAYGSYETLLADPEIDAVYIPLPNELHRPWVEKAADAGKHILCEKPLALNAAEAEAMVEYCWSRKVLLMEAFMWPHQPRSREVRDRVESGEIGDLRLIRSSFSFSIEPNDWRLDPSRGGGALWDIGTYGVSTARYFSREEPERIRATAFFGPSGVDMSLTAELRFPSGVIGLIDCSFEQPFRCAYELVGTGGSFIVPDAYLPPEEPTAIFYGMDDKPRTLTFAGTNQYAMMVDAFAQSVASGRLVPPADDGLNQMRALDAILASAKE
jgi:predicted dehydrogenase